MTASPTARGDGRAVEGREEAPLRAAGRQTARRGPPPQPHAKPHPVRHVEKLPGDLAKPHHCKPRANFLPQVSPSSACCCFGFVSPPIAVESAPPTPQVAGTVIVGVLLGSVAGTAVGVIVAVLIGSVCGGGLGMLFVHARS